MLTIRNNSNSCIKREAVRTMLAEIVLNYPAVIYTTVIKTSPIVHEPVGWSVSSGGINLNGNF